MPSETLPASSSSCHAITGKPLHLCGDEEFDEVFPEHVRDLSPCHWSPVEACLQAARWLVTKPGTRVLDVGCGPGKFCVIGAATTSGHFTGVEQRAHLCRTARTVIKKHAIPRVEILHANVTHVDFGNYDVFYLFNPFEENLVESLRIDDGVTLANTLFIQYTRWVNRALSLLRAGTRVVTFHGDCEEIPSCYRCEETAFDGKLRLWIKDHLSPNPGSTLHRIGHRA